jgi:hypothetical protein
LDEFWGKKLLSLLHRCLAERDQALKLEALLTLRTALETASDAQSLQVACSGSGSGGGGMLGAVLAVVGDDWYRAIAEALRVLAALVPVLRPWRVDAATGQCTGFLDAPAGCDFRPAAQRIFASVLPRVESLDIDIEIKEAALAAVGVLFSYAGDELSPHLGPVLGESYPLPLSPCRVIYRFVCICV